MDEVYDYQHTFYTGLHYIALGANSARKVERKQVLL